VVSAATLRYVETISLNVHERTLIGACACNVCHAAAITWSISSDRQSVALTAIIPGDSRRPPPTACTNARHGWRWPTVLAADHGLASNWPWLGPDVVACHHDDADQTQQACLFCDVLNVRARRRIDFWPRRSIVSAYCPSAVRRRQLCAVLSRQGFDVRVGYRVKRSERHEAGRFHDRLNNLLHGTAVWLTTSARYCLKALVLPCTSLSAASEVIRQNIRWAKMFYCCQKERKPAFKVCFGKLLDEDCVARL